VREREVDWIVLSLYIVARLCEEEWKAEQQQQHPDDGGGGMIWI
jgi:hypothetical protein